MISLPEASMLQPVALRNLQPMLGRYSIIDHYYFDCYILLAHKISVYIIIYQLSL
jgi:hypothetical protein